MPTPSADHRAGDDAADTGHRAVWEHPDARLPIDPDLAPDDPAEPRRDHRPVPHVRRGSRLDVVASIAAGGFLGTLARYGVALLLPADGRGLPWGTFAVNASGSLALGFLLAALLERGRASSRWRTLSCVGFLGSWTTMSSLATEADLLVQHGHVAVAAVDVLATAVVGIALSWAGIVAARARFAREPGWSSPSS
jgi:CrcB protein